MSVRQTSNRLRWLLDLRILTDFEALTDIGLENRASPISPRNPHRHPSAKPIEMPPTYRFGAFSHQEISTIPAVRPISSLAWRNLRCEGFASGAPQGALRPAVAQPSTCTISIRPVAGHVRSWLTLLDVHPHHQHAKVGSGRTEHTAFRVRYVYG